MSSLLSKFIQHCTTTAHQTVSGLAKKPCTHSGLEKNLEFLLILNLGKQLSHLFCLSGQQHVNVLACFNYWFSWKMTSFNPVANQASEFQNYWPGKKISSSRTTGVDFFHALHNVHGSLHVSRKLLTYPSPKPTFCPKGEVSVNVGLGEGRWAKELGRFFLTITTLPISWLSN